jgi:hypothetical protein
VQSLLLLQPRTTADEDVAQPLRESAARIQVFGTMHEHLYRMGAASTVEISTYLRTLLEDQQTAFGSGETSRKITLEADQALWPSSEAPALGMIVVELVTNALKYGEDRAGDFASLGDGRRRRFGSPTALTDAVQNSTQAGGLGSVAHPSHLVSNPRLNQVVRASPG